MESRVKAGRERGGPEGLEGRGGASADGEVFFGGEGEVGADGVAEAGLLEVEGEGVAGDDPGGVGHDGLRGFAAEGGAFGGFGEEDEALVEGVEGRVDVVGAVGAGGDVLGVEELEEVLGVGVVAEPDEAEHLGLAEFDFLQEGGPVVVGGDEADTDFVEEGGEEFGGLADFGGFGVADFEGEFEAAAGGGVAPAGVAGFVEEGAGAVEVVGVGERVGGVVAGDAGGKDGVGGEEASVLEAGPFVVVEGVGEGLAEGAVGADDGVVEVEGVVGGGEGGGGFEADAAGGDFGAQGGACRRARLGPTTGSSRLKA